jgi:ABC-2 type transport system permease protein
MLNGIAETGLKDYLSYQDQVNAFQKVWVDFMSYYIIRDKNLNLKDLHNLPQFKLKPLMHKNMDIMLGILYLFSISFCVIFLSTKIRAKI